MGVPRGLPRVSQMWVSPVIIDEDPHHQLIFAGRALQPVRDARCPPCLPTSAGCPGLRHHQQAELWPRELGSGRKAWGRTGGAVLSICWALSGLLPKVSWRSRTPRGRRSRSGKPQRKNGGLGAYVNRCLCPSGTVPWRHREGTGILRALGKATSTWQYWRKYI